MNYTLSVFTEREFCICFCETVSADLQNADLQMQIQKQRAPLWRCSRTAPREPPGSVPEG
jgi:hypothetical protein